MRTVKTKGDLESLRQAGDLPQELIDLLEKDLMLAIEAHSDGEAGLAYEPEDDGYLVVVEEDDDPEALSSVGLPGGDLLSCAEVVEPVHASESGSWQRAIVVYNNQCAMCFYATEGWLQRHFGPALGEGGVGRAEPAPLAFGERW
ncbi:MAG: hypothetical protein ACOY4I_13370 [Bacillota bacterium]